MLGCVFQKARKWHKVAILVGKCRVALIRNMTVAKLEMQAAVFGVRLRELILEEHDIEVDLIVH